MHNLFCQSFTARCLCKAPQSEVKAFVLGRAKAKHPLREAMQIFRREMRSELAAADANFQRFWTTRTTFLYDSAPTIGPMLPNNINELNTGLRGRLTLEFHFAFGKTENREGPSSLAAKFPFCQGSQHGLHLLSCPRI